jgi:hypothetical protein
LNVIIVKSFVVALLTSQISLQEKSSKKSGKDKPKHRHHYKYSDPVDEKEISGELAGFKSLIFKYKVFKVHVKID